MKETIHLFVNKNLLKIIEEMLSDYNLTPLNFGDFKNNNLVNKNILLFFGSHFKEKIDDFFFKNNNVIIFCISKDVLINVSKSVSVKTFFGKLTFEKFLDEIKIQFLSKKIILKNTALLDNQINNTELAIFSSLTPIEKKILIILFENKEINKNYLLENVLKVKQNSETKTLASHLTRIRRKLFNIKSDIQIVTKEDSFYLKF